MKPHPLSLLFVLTLAVAEHTFSQRVAAGEVPIIPTPQIVQRVTLSFKLTSQTRVILGDHITAADESAVRQINERLEKLERAPLRIVREKSLRKTGREYLYLGSPLGAFGARWLREKGVLFEPRMHDEGYVLDVSQDGIVILGQTAAGRFYGVMSLLQLLEHQKKSVTVPGARIIDWPQQRLRGITDDISRGQVSTLENFKVIIRRLARYKLNVYSPYIEDVFTFTHHPRIGEGRGALTANEVKELDRYARQYHVEMIPTFETLGHWENILALPDYLQYAEFPGASGLNVSNEAIYPLLDGMIAELSEAFSSSYFNMAADESVNVGLGGSKAKVAATDLATVHADHYNRLFEILKKYKKKPMMYGDIILANPPILERIPKSTIIIDWQYDPEEHYPSTEVFKNAGFPLIVCPAVWNFNNPFPNHLNAALNIQTLTRDGFRNGSFGVLTSSWGNLGGETLRELNTYGYAWTAECAWRPMDANLERFHMLFFRDLFGDDRAGLIGQTVYALLAQPLNQVNWHEVWRHPLLPLRPALQPMLLRLGSLRSTLPLIRRHLAELQASSPANGGQIRLLAFITNLHEWFAEKVTVAEALKEMVSAKDRKDGAKNRDELVARAKELVDRLRHLKNEFSSLWMETNRSANLHLLLTRYDRQVRYWEESIRAVEQTGTLPDPLIESAWIYHPSGNPGKRDSSLPQVRKAYFKKTITLEHPVIGASVQLIGDTQVQLWINGLMVGELYARRSPSLTVEHQRVKIWEIGSFLRVGENVVAVEAANYDRFGSAGFNLYGELRLGSETRVVKSDSSWSVSLQPSADWKTTPVGIDGWERAKPNPYPFVVVRPNLEKGLVSWIER